MDTGTILLLLLTVYIGAWVYIRKNPAAHKRGIVPYGPTIMLKTQVGKELVDKLARPKRFWRAYASLSKLIVFGLMAFITGLLLWQLTFISSIPRESALGPEYILGIPGLNPIIPIGYGVIALIICIFVHEAAHGILARVNGMEIKNTGLLFLVFPIGAFVEPDGEALVKAGKRERSDVYAVGASTNFIIAIILVLLLTVPMLGSVEASHPDNPVIILVDGGSPADHAGLGIGTLVLEFDGSPINDIDGFFEYNGTDPGSLVNLTVADKDGQYVVEMIHGVFLSMVQSGMPAHDAGVRSGMLLKSIDNTTIRSLAEFNSFMDDTSPGQTVEVMTFKYDRETGWNESGPFQITLTDGPLDKGYMGLTPNLAGMGINTPENILNFIKDPYANTEGSQEFVLDTLRFLALPFLGLSPMPAELTWLFENEGFLQGDAFWIAVNLIYWIFWMNLMIGLTNSLPAVPLDGGFLLMDALDGVVKKVNKKADEEERRRIVETVTGWLALLILFLIIWQFVGPRL